jgi:small subunit ribosomal protein S21
MSKSCGPSKTYEELNFKPLEVKVSYNNFDDAFRKFKTLVQAEGVLALYKEKQSYEKPSVKKNRKIREAESRRLLQESREAQILSGEWEKRQKKKETKRLQKVEERRRQQGENSIEE